MKKKLSQLDVITNILLVILIFLPALYKNLDISKIKIISYDVYLGFLITALLIFLYIRYLMNRNRLVYFLSFFWIISIPLIFLSIESIFFIGLATSIVISITGLFKEKKFKRIFLLINLPLMLLAGIMLFLLIAIASLPTYF